MQGDSSAACGVEVFISYCREDIALCRELNKHLAQLKREGLTVVWYDRDIVAGALWAKEIDDHIKSASLILLLISADFLNSDYCTETEGARAMRQHRSGHAKVVPVVLRPVDWESSVFAELSVLPSGGTPVVDWPSLDHAFRNVVKGIRTLLSDLPPRRANQDCTHSDLSNDMSDESDLSGVDSSSSTAAAVVTGTVNVEVTIAREYDSFSDEDLRQLCEKIGNVLGIAGGVKIVDKRRGSVRLTFRLPPEQADRLCRAVEQSELGEFDVVGVQVLDESGRSRDASQDFLVSTTASVTERKLDVPAGLTLLQTLRGHENWINRLAWHPDGLMMATPSSDKTVQIWDVESGKCLRFIADDGIVISVAWSPDGSILATSSEDWKIRLYETRTWQKTKELTGHTNWVVDVAWSPDGRFLASSSLDKSIHIWDTASWQLIHELKKPHSDPRDNVYSISWSSDSRSLASAYGDACIRIWDAASGELSRILGGHLDQVLCVAWSPRENDPTIVSGSLDHTIRVWNAETGRPTCVLQGHTGPVRAVCLSSEASHLASKSADNTVRLWWRADDVWMPVGELRETTGGEWLPGLAFHSDPPRLATLGGNDCEVRIWEVDFDVLSDRSESDQATHARCAKVVLVGDTGVGKTGLGLVLAGKEYEPTDSTHVMNVRELDVSQTPPENDRFEERRTLLWDLAGQPMQRLVNRLHLHDAAVALVLFDSRSEIDPFAGVAYWARALDEAARGMPPVKYLVAARTDRGGTQASRERIDEVMARYGFRGYFETSAREGFGIDELKEEVLRAIPWEDLPVVASSQLITRVTRFLQRVRSGQDGSILATTDELLAGFCQDAPQLPLSKEVFAGCLAGLEKIGWVRRLSFGDQVLLQPRLLDDYCGWLVLAARDQPDIHGYISEDEARRGGFRMDADRTLAGRPEEEAMLVATVREVVGRNIANRQETDGGVMLVFPSEVAINVPDYPGGYDLALSYRFEGPVKAIYATLAVTLINSVAFTLRSLYRNSALFDAPCERLCGFAVEYPDGANDALGRLTVFFDEDTSKETRLQFLRYLNRHLERMAFEGTVQRERVYRCTSCDFTIPAEAVGKSIEYGRSIVTCPVCARRFQIDDLAEQSSMDDETLDRIDAAAESERARQQRLAVLDQKAKWKDYDVFLCHDSKDKREVRWLADRLIDWGVLPWIDERAIGAGGLFVAEMEQALESIPAIAIIVGPHGPGCWQEMEYYAAMQRYVKSRDKTGQQPARIIPVLLPGVDEVPELPVFLRMFNYVDLRQGDPRDQMQRLVEALLGGR